MWEYVVMGRGTQSQRETQHPQRLAVRSCFLSLVRQASCSPQTVIDVPGVCVLGLRKHTSTLLGVRGLQKGGLVLCDAAYQERFGQIANRLLTQSLTSW